MLLQLKINNFAIIDELVVEFANGMSVITGETGAGKSILVDALEQLLKQRASTHFVGPSNSSAYIEAVFDVFAFQNHPVFKQYDIDCQDALMVSKQIEKSGRSTIRINGQIKPFSVLKELMTCIVNLHGQFDVNQLMDEYGALFFIDQLAKMDKFEPFNQYQTMFLQFQNLQKELNALLKKKDQADYLEHITNQVNELADYLFTEQQIDDLILEKQHLDQFEKDFEAMSLTLVTLNQNQVMNHIYEGQRLLEKTDNPLSNNLGEIYYQVEDFISLLQNNIDSAYFDSDRYQYLTETLFEIKRLQKKYGFDLFNFYEQIKNEQIALTHIDEHCEDLQNRLNVLNQEMLQLCFEIEKKRRSTIQSFEIQISELFTQLYLDEAHLIVDTEELNNFTRNGNTRARFMVKMNKGHDYQSLTQIASGGELSRIMLALKVILAQVEQHNVYIFDEIDTGVSGRVAIAMGKVMHKLSLTHQVIVITHLAQVASQADAHYVVKKNKESDTTFSQLALLDQDAHLREIATMLSGDNVTHAALLQAKELIDGK